MAWTAVIILLALFVDRYLVVLWMNIEKEHGFYISITIPQKLGLFLHHRSTSFSVIIDFY